MKNLFTFLFWFILVVICFAAPYKISKGFGKIVNSTSISQKIQFLDGTNGVYATTVNVLNEGTNVVFYAINTTTNNFDSMVFNGQAIAVPPAKNLDIKGENITSLCLKTTNGNSLVYIEAY